ncbi:MAG: hypothetical protein OEZ34_00765 [Spirochaetia bacterium]|nr:hypothetical protein [Spirochaetia bacterium]
MPRVVNEKSEARIHPKAETEQIVRAKKHPVKSIKKGSVPSSSKKTETVKVKKKSRAPSQKSMKSLVQYMKQLEKENSILARELVQKKERRLNLPVIDHEENKMAMARINLRITETESLMAHQKKNISHVKGLISSQEERMKEITEKIEELQKKMHNQSVPPGDAKVQLEDLLSELKKLRSRREKALAGLAV